MRRPWPDPSRHRLLRHGRHARPADARAGARPRRCRLGLAGDGPDRRRARPPGGRVAGSFGSLGFTDAPAVTSLVATPTATGTTVGLDIWHRDFGTLGLAGVMPAVHPAMLAGVIPHAVERALLEGGPASADGSLVPAVGVGAVFAAAAQGIPTRVRGQHPHGRRHRPAGLPTRAGGHRCRPARHRPRASRRPGRTASSWLVDRGPRLRRGDRPDGRWRRDRHNGVCRGDRRWSCLVDRSRAVARLREEVRDPRRGTVSEPHRTELDERRCGSSGSSQTTGGHRAGGGPVPTESVPDLVSWVALKSLAISGSVVISPRSVSMPGHHSTPAREASSMAARSSRVNTGDQSAPKTRKVGMSRRTISAPGCAAA